MVGSWAAALGLALCLAVGAEHVPPQPAVGKDSPASGGTPKGPTPPHLAMSLPAAALLRDNFRLQPGDLVATAGQELELDCVPPSGHPEPRVTWKKDGVTLDPSGERYVVTEGKLRVMAARRSDSGLYVCMATNTAGQRESRGARVTVLEKPTITRHPSDTVAVVGGTVELGCGAQGDPVPRVQWHKERGDLPWGRHEVDQEHTLHLYAVTPADAGTYVCTAQSQLGTAAATAHLHVQDQLPPGRREPTPQDLLAMRLHLENGTTLPAGTVWLHWRMVTPVPAPEGYMVLYRSLLPASTSWAQHNAGKELSTTIPALRRGHQYEFKVRPYSGGTQGLDSNSRNLWIPEEVPSAAPQSVTVAEKGNGTVVVSWEPPPPEAHNGIIRGYKVWSTSEGWQHPTNRTVYGGTRHLEAPLPTSGVEFCVQVAAFTSVGAGVPSNVTCSLLGWSAGSSRVVQVLRQPAVIAATSSLLWVALVLLLLLLCQRRAGQDNTTHGGLVASDSPWLGGPWKPGCAPHNLSSSSSLSSRLLGSDPHPSSLSLEHPSLGPPTPPPHSSHSGGHLAAPEDTGTCGRGHFGVHSSPSTPTPAPWERGHKKAHPELHPVHSTPVLTGGPGHVPVTGSRDKGGTDLGLGARWPWPRGSEGDTGGDPWRLPAFSSPRAPRPPHAWHPPVTRSPATVCPSDIFLVTGCPKDISLVIRRPKDVSSVTGIPKDVSPVTRHPKDVSPVTGIPRDMSPTTQCPKDTFLVTESPQDVSPVARHPRDMSPTTRHKKDKISATRPPDEMSPVTRHLRNMSSVPGHCRDMVLGSRYSNDMSPATRHPRDPSVMTKQQRDTFLPSRYPEDMSPVTRHPEEMSPASSHRKDTFLSSRYPKDTRTRLPQDGSPLPGRLSPALSDGVLTPQQVAEDLEMDQATTCPRSAPSSWDNTTVADDLKMDQATTMSPCSPPVLRSFSPTHTYGYIYGPPASELDEGEEEEEEEEEEQPGMRGSLGGSLLNGWGSVSEDNLASARCSLVSSCDGSFLLDASFARALAVAVDGLCFSLEDTDESYRGPSPSLSPLERIFSPDVPIPPWDWGTVLGVPPQGGHRTGISSIWAGAGDKPRTGDTEVWQSPGGGTRQVQSPLRSAKLQLY